MYIKVSILKGRYLVTQFVPYDLFSFSVCTCSVFLTCKFSNLVANLRISMGSNLLTSQYEKNIKAPCIESKFMESDPDYKKCLINYLISTFSIKVQLIF